MTDDIIQAQMVMLYPQDYTQQEYEQAKNLLQQHQTELEFVQELEVLRQHLDYLYTDQISKESILSLDERALIMQEARQHLQKTPAKSSSQESWWQSLLSPQFTAFAFLCVLLLLVWQPLSQQYESGLSLTQEADKFAVQKEVPKDVLNERERKQERMLAHIQETPVDDIEKGTPNIPLEDDARADLSLDSKSTVSLEFREKAVKVSKRDRTPSKRARKARTIRKAKKAKQSKRVKYKKSKRRSKRKPTPKAKSAATPPPPPPPPPPPSVARDAEPTPNSDSASASAPAIRSTTQPLPSSTTTTSSDEQLPMPSELDTVEEEVMQKDVKTNTPQRVGGTSQSKITPWQTASDHYHKGNIQDALRALLQWIQTHQNHSRYQDALYLGISWAKKHDQQRYLDLFNRLLPNERSYKKSRRNTSPKNSETLESDTSF